MLLHTLAVGLLLLCASTHRVDAAANKEVHAFFYLWYGNPETDGKMLHWDHDILQHWTPSIAAQYPKGRFLPPGDIGATYMPARGFYSSNDPATLESQCLEMAAAGIDVVVASWWPANRPDGQGVDTDRCVPNLLDAASKAGLKVNFHLEPYTDRNPLTVRVDLEYIIAQYGSHPAFYRHPTRGLPMVYVYDTYLNPAAEWAALFSREGAHTIRGTGIDHIIIALVLEARDRTFMRDAHVDGFYTYFSAQRFSYASTLSSWPTLATWAKEDNLCQSADTDTAAGLRSLLHVDDLT
jgi:glycoprotein endo-alpha-1,2-mannosidase